MYEYTDKALKIADKTLIREFNRLKSLSALTHFDEMNVLKAVNKAFDVVKKEIRKCYLLIAKSVYRDWYKGNKDLKSLDDEWVDEILEGYDKVTKYVFNHEEDRKRARLIETIIASDTKAVDIDKAMKYLALQYHEFAVRVTDDAVLKALIDSGEKYAVWVTEKDEKVCKACKARDGKIYPIKDFPPKEHIGCRCKRRRLRGSDKQGNG